MQTFATKYLANIARITEAVDKQELQRVADALAILRGVSGRLFLIGVGGSAAACSHAANDFRKLCNIDAHALDNISLLTAYVNDCGWAHYARKWLEDSHLSAEDTVMIVSVGGGSSVLSPFIKEVIDYAREQAADVLGIVGRDGGYTLQNAHACIVVPTVDPQSVTMYTESFHSILLHLLVSYLSLETPTWEARR